LQLHPIFTNNELHVGWLSHRPNCSLPPSFIHSFILYSLALSLIPILPESFTHLSTNSLTRLHIHSITSSCSSSGGRG